MKTEKTVTQETLSKAAAATVVGAKTTKRSLRPMKSMVGVRSARPRTATMFANRKEANA